MVELDERLGDDEPALGQVGAGIRERDRRLELCHVLVAQVSDDGLVERLGLLEVDDPRPVAEERVPTEAAVLDRFEEERRSLLGAQPEIGPERSDEICGYDSGCIHFGKQKDPRREVSSGTGCGLGQIRRRCRPARGASSRPRDWTGESSPSG